VNQIDKIRSAIEKNFNEKTFHKGTFETYLSPSKQYRLDATNFWSRDPHWDLTKAEIYDQNLNEKIFEFFVNDSRVLHGWVTANKVDYLVLAEDIFGGQTVVDLTKRHMAGYSPNEEGFIWTDFHLSPDGNILATIGCYWACPYVLKLFDFSDPLNLPLKEIKEIPLLGNDEIILGWLDNTTLIMKRIQKVQEPEYFDGRSMRMKTISEINIEREIKIDNS
jgi:hypothetical protein